LFQAVSKTLQTIARDERHLRVRVGFLAVLHHTWGQNLMLRPHLHCVVPGGGLSLEGRSWIPCRKGFMRIRGYDFFANRNRKEELDLC